MMHRWKSTHHVSELTLFKCQGLCSPSYFEMPIWHPVLPCWCCRYPPCLNYLFPPRWRPPVSRCCALSSHLSPCLCHWSRFCLYFVCCLFLVCFIVSLCLRLNPHLCPVTCLWHLFSKYKNIIYNIGVWYAYIIVIWCRVGSSHNGFTDIISRR